ncbi:hypothetical protein P8452_51574 [Trifolium repens]|nr:hypothetical protein P8452_51574 [Trifolium repens]
MSFSHRAGITTPLHCQTRTSPPSLARFHSHGESHPFSLTNGCVKIKTHKQKHLWYEDSAIFLVEPFYSGLTQFELKQKF